MSGVATARLAFANQESQVELRGSSIDTPIKPFLKWAGGKQQLIKDIAPYAPKKFNRYFEPFVGGGAVFFHLNPGKAVLADVNEELINCYTVIRDNVEALLESLDHHENSSEYFYAMRATEPETLSTIARASRFIYLNRTCFNGLYRVNKKGQFNVPFGKYKNPNFKQTDRLMEAHAALQKVELVIGDFKTVTKEPAKGDFIYLDPPYHPLDGYADFKRYDKNFFGEEDHIILAETFAELSRRGCYVMLSNSDTPFTRELYKNWNVRTVFAKRLINCDATKRKGVNELIVTNY